MTYIENALYDFIKSILSRGYNTLKDPRYLPYSIVLVIVVSTATIAAFIGDLTAVNLDESILDILLYVELSVAISYILVGLIVGKFPTSFQMVLIFIITILSTMAFMFDVIPNSFGVASTITGALYILWIIIATFGTFSLFRDLFENDVFGTVLFLGKPSDDGRVMFRFVAWILAFVNLGLGYFVLTNGAERNSNSLTITGLIVIMLSLVAMVPLLNLQKKYDVFFTILTAFFMFTSIRVLLLAWRTMSNTTGGTSFWDSLFSLFFALYAIQNAAVKGIHIGETVDEDLPVEEKVMKDEKSVLGFSLLIERLLSDKGIILFILGVVIGFHTLQVQTILGRENIFDQFALTADADIVLLGYEANLAASFLIYILALILFLLIPSFRTYANPEINRISWAPPYDDLKLLILAIKNDEISWKGDVVKMFTSVAAGKIKGKFGGTSDPEEHIKNLVTKLIDKSKAEMNN